MAGITTTQPEEFQRLLGFVEKPGLLNEGHVVRLYDRNGSTKLAVLFHDDCNRFREKLEKINPLLYDLRTNKGYDPLTYKKQIFDYSEISYYDRRKKV